ncbi:hypothetical protein [Winogradskyella aquimaris]|uniref:Uncharacterized protein n=1 Tax=Winogradskyella aquimaris TaxID=864074 RepID=A0ABU5ENK4_9FLAO|nr:hypothetical protein [Winogradskyella aquimaris]MDY2587105.1 hypothetical protein [Winogradskyella aquimaris]
MKIFKLKSLFYLLLIFGLVLNYNCSNESMDSESISERKGKKPIKKGNQNLFVISQDCAVSQSTNLYAGQNMLVGEVTVEVVEDNYLITYGVFSAQYCLTETHLSVVETPSDFPINGGGNPKIGQFEYSDSHDCVSSVSYTVPVSKGTYIAAHAVVNCVEDNSASNDFGFNLPGEVSFCVTNKAPNTENSYFEITVAEGNSLSGVNLEAWCVDYESSLNNGQCVDIAQVYSTYDDIPNEAFVNNGPFDVQGINDEINFILNYSFVGQQYLETNETYIMGDVQLAIWSLIEGNTAEQLYNWMTQPQILGDISLDRVAEIISIATQNDGYVPSCGEYVAIILIPQDGKQPVIIPKEVICNEGDCDETAWADGCDFPGNSWATYFHYQSAN